MSNSPRPALILSCVALLASVGGVRAASRSASGHWAFQPIRSPRLPEGRDLAALPNPLDRFVRSRLEREGIAPSPPASRNTLIRRVSLDLTGLPPTPEEVAAFASDPRPDAYERVVDRLLASPHYGERWARLWLDLAHYADSDGYLTDQLRPWAWRWRDWLIDSLNRDVPFNRLTLEMLAGDLIPGAGLRERMGTGFLRQTLSNREGGADLEEFRVEQVVDRVETVGTAFLGLTVGCARCHDHKHDPIRQREFYRLYAFFDAADEVNLDAPLPGEWGAYLDREPEVRRRREALIAPVRAELEALQLRWEARLRHASEHPGEDPAWDRHWEVLGLIWGGNLGEGQLEGTQIVLTPPARRTADERDRLLEYFLQRGSPIDEAAFARLKLGTLSNQLAALRKELPPLARAPVMRSARVPRGVRVHLRGDFRAPGEVVTPGVPAVLPPLPPGAGDRLALARWLTSPGHPLTARVTVNRLWQEFFGQGLVRTSGDFGTRGDRPSHPELLDWLASELIRQGWSLKATQRLIVTSATYRQSSRHRPDLARLDPGNRLLARQSALRLSADQVRDAALAVSGLLNTRVGGPSVFPPQPESVTSEGFDNRWVASQGPDRYRRALYTWVQRLSPFAQAVTFDAPGTSKSCTRRERSNSPLQALTLLNDPVFREAARGLAARATTEGSTGWEGVLRRAFQLTLARHPSPAETSRLRTYWDQERRRHGVGSGPLSADEAAWQATCSILINLHEFITRD